MNEEIPVYVLARSGRIRDGLTALLRTVPRLGAVRYMNHELSEWESISDEKQTLVLLDANLIDPQLYRYLKQHTHRKCIVLADNVWQQQQARAAGVDEVLLAGFPAAQLFTAIDKLFGQAAIPPEEIRRRNGTTGTK